MKLIIYFMILLGIASCSDTTIETTSLDQISTPTLIIFVNPKGGPCRMQASIVTEMSEELKKQVHVRYVRTDIPSDQKIFYQYGIRGLPTVLLTDSTGREIKRLSPGVQPAVSIRNLLKSVTRG